jgi:transglutaminase-like putative cysteine protease
VARSDQLEITVPFLVGRQPTVRSVGGVTNGRIDEAVVHFRPFGEDDVGYVTYPSVRRTRYDAIESTFRRSPYARTWELAKQFRATAETPFEYILLVNDYLRSGEFGYSERPQQPPAGRAPLDGFLIDTKEGYCQHFSGAMALLLRMGGIPARVATGFSPGGFSKRRDAWIVRDTDAHAWVEAWFDELGWITYDPTPDATPARSQIAALEAAPAPIPTTATESDPAGGGVGSQQPGGLRPNLLFDPLRNSPETPSDEQGTGPAWWAWALMGLAVVLVAFGVFRWLRGRRRRGHLSPLDRAVAELDAALRRAGRPLPTGTTLRQLEQRLGASPDATAYLRALSASRYGPEATLPTSAQRKALRRALAQGLGPAGKLRALWALPPRPR